MVCINNLKPIASGWSKRVKRSEDIIIIGDNIMINEIQRIV